jgi:hypothetical protein
MVEGDLKSTDVQSACVLRPPLWLVHLVNRQKGGRAGENETHDRRAICQLPNLAKNPRSSVPLGTTGMPSILLQNYFWATRTQD